MKLMLSLQVADVIVSLINYCYLWDTHPQESNAFKCFKYSLYSLEIVIQSSVLVLTIISIKFVFSNTAETCFKNAKEEATLLKVINITQLISLSIFSF